MHVAFGGILLAKSHIKRLEIHGFGSNFFCPSTFWLPRCKRLLRSVEEIPLDYHTDITDKWDWIFTKEDLQGI